MLKKPRLCLGIFLHGMVKIKVILSKIRERAHLKINTCNTVQSQGVGRYLHNDMGAAGVRHLAEKLLKLEAFGSGALGVNKLIAYHIAVCPDKPDFGIELLLKKMLHEIGAGCFSVCTCNADNAHFSGGISEVIAACHRKSIPAVINENIRYINTRRPVAQYNARAVFNGGGNVSIAVGLKARNRDEHIPRFCSSGVIAYSVNLHAYIRLKLKHLYVF